MTRLADPTAMDLSLLHSSTQLISRERGMGLMLLLSIGLHLTVVLFFDVLRPRLPKLPRPVYYMDLTKRPLATPRTIPPPSIVPERERKIAPSRPALTPPPTQPANGPVAPAAKENSQPQPRREEPAPISSALQNAVRTPVAETLASDPALEKVAPPSQIPPRPREEIPPESAKVAFARTDGEVPLPAPADSAGERYNHPAVASTQRPPDSFSRRQSIEPDLPTTAIASRRLRENLSAIPAPSGRSKTALLGAAPVELALPPPAAASSAMPPATRPQQPERSFDFLDRVAPTDLDRSQLVSLNRLRTCLDPEAEMKLRTRLATLLSRPATCRFGGVVFDIHQPESAWSIHVDIYNYEQKAFENRCAALELAVASCEMARR